MKKIAQHICNFCIVQIIFFASNMHIATAQTDVQLTNYMFNELSFNPAYAGSTKELRASLFVRKQWMSFAHSPLTQTFSIDNNTNFGGIGFNAIHDQVGYERAIYAKGLYSYTVEVTQSSLLTLGLAAGIIHRSLDGSLFEFQDDIAIDPVSITDMQAKIKPTFDFGVQYFTEKFAIAASTAHLQTSVKNSNNFSMPRHFYMFGQYKFVQNEHITWVPTLYAKTGSNILQVEANTNVYFNKKFWVGASYRVQESVAGLIGIILAEQFYIGYSYDYNLGGVKNYSLGSHEVFLMFRKKAAPPQAGFYQSTRLFN